MVKMLFLSAFLSFCVVSAGVVQAQETFSGPEMYDPNYVKTFQKFKQEFETLKDRAEGGDRDAQYKLGKVYMQGGPGLPRSLRKAVPWLEKAANAGHGAAAYEVGNLYIGGFGGLTQDIPKGVDFIKKSANERFTPAMLLLGVTHITGETFGIRKDYVTAYKWLALAEEEGAEEATKALEQLRPHMNGRQVDQAKQRVKAFNKGSYYRK